MRPRPLGGPGRARAAARRADPRRRRGGEGGDPPPPARAGPSRPGDPRRLLGDARAARALRPDRGHAPGAAAGRAAEGTGDRPRSAAPRHRHEMSEAAAVPVPVAPRATWWQRLGPLVGLVLLFLLLAIASPLFLTVDSLLSVTRH